MNRVAACAIVGMCISLSACKSAEVPPPAPPPPPAPAPEAACTRPAICPDYSTTIRVPKSGIVSQQCIFVDMTKVSKVAWEGSSDVKTLAIQWADISLDGYCDNKPTATADCKDKTCNFDLSKLPAKTDELYCLCYGATATAKDGMTSVADPRLIIRR